MPRIEGGAVRPGLAERVQHVGRGEQARGYEFLRVELRRAAPSSPDARIPAG